jgi:hypothetical protein
MPRKKKEIFGYYRSQVRRTPFNFADNGEARAAHVTESAVPYNCDAQVVG